MKLKNQLIISIIVFGIVLLVIATSVLITNQQETQISKQEQMANDVNTGASNLTYIANDYFLYPQSSELILWQNQFSSLSAEISKLTSSSPTQMVLISNVQGDLQRLNEVFNSSVSILQSVPSNDSASGYPAFQTASSRLNVQNQALAFDGSVLSKSLASQDDQVKQINTILILTLLCAFGAYFVMVYYLVFRRTFRSITKLQDGTKIIGSGNLDYSIAAQSNDEIGELSQSFNQMTKNLKTVTASKSDLEQAQASLRGSEQRWATTLASIGDAVIATDTSGNNTFMNGEAEELTGWTLSDVSEKPVKTAFNIVNEQTRLEVENPIERVLKEGMVVGLANHTVLIRKDGSEVPVDDSGAPIKDKEGKTKGVVLIFRDITERKKTEEQIARLASFPSLNPNPIVEMDFDGKIEYINPAALAVFADIETLGLNHPFFASWKNATEAFAEKTANTFTCEVKVGDDWYLQNYSNVPNVQRIRVYALNITESKNAQEAIKRQAELIDLTPSATVVRNLEGTISFWSKGAEKLYGWSKDEAIGQNIDSLLKTEISQHLGDVMNKLKLDGKWSGEIVHISKDGSKVAEQSFWLARFDGDGKIFEVLESNTDITERVELQSKLEESAVRVEEYANQMEELANTRLSQLKDSERLAAIGATAGMVGHDIRNPLQAITSDLFLAKSDIASFPESEEKKNAIESMDEIGKNIEYINKIVQDLQDYARPLNPKFEESDLKLIVEGSVAKNSFPENIEVKVKVADEARKINVDSYYLNRILYNLVTNSIQAMPQGGKLTLEAHKEAKDIVISVADTGVGIPKNVRDKMFTLMFTTKSKGQGFGLPVVKRMTEALGGTVSFESKEGKGTTFTIRLPPPPKRLER